MAPARANPSRYEPGVDPGVGFNLVSWANFGSSGAAVWENAVQSVYDAGFDEVSLSPVRYYAMGAGSIASTSSSGPELSHVAAGIGRAKSLGMRVTVNPFVEPAGFTEWRGFYDPTPGSVESQTFWTDYGQYIAEVATMAESNGADSITVGTELRALSRNSGNNTQWNSVINVADAAFSGTIGYAANWDNYNNANVANAIWEHPGIDYLGIDSYFQGLLNNNQADVSGTYPNSTFLDQVESAWNHKLDDEILPFASSRKAGVGMPVEFTEVGYLPYNRTGVTPQNSSGSLDQDEQNMVFEGLMRALDGRLASGDLLASHIWQWGMPGSNGSQWNIDPQGGDQPNNQQTAQWLSSFVNGTNPGDPGDPPAGATQVLYSFEAGLDGFQFPNFGGSSSSLTQSTGSGNTDGNSALAITKTDDDWTWDARVIMTGDQLQAMLDAVAENLGDYVLELDVTYVASDLHAALSDLNMHIAFQSGPGGAWGQAFPFADINSPVDQTFHVEIPLDSLDNANTLIAGIDALNFHIGFDGTWPSGNATVYLDRIALTDTTFVALDSGDFDSDGDVDGADYLAWQRGLGLLAGATLAQGDANGDGAVDDLDLEIWHSQYGTAALVAQSAFAVPEPMTFWIGLATGLMLFLLRKSYRAPRVAGA